MVFLRCNSYHHGSCSTTVSGRRSITWPTRCRRSTRSCVASDDSRGRRRAVVGPRTSWSRQKKKHVRRTPPTGGMVAEYTARGRDRRRVATRAPRDAAGVCPSCPTLGDGGTAVARRRARAHGRCRGSRPRCRAGGKCRRRLSSAHVCASDCSATARSIARVVGQLVNGAVPGAELRAVLTRHPETVPAAYAVADVHGLVNGADVVLEAAGHDPGGARAGDHRSRLRSPRGFGWCARRSRAARNARRGWPRPIASHERRDRRSRSSAGGGAGRGIHPCRVDDDQAIVRAGAAVDGRRGASARVRQPPASRCSTAARPRRPAGSRGR